MSRDSCPRNILNNPCFPLTISGSGITTLSGTSPISASVSGKSGVISHNSSGVSANIYGDTSNIPQITIDTTGHITTASDIAINTGDDVSLDSLGGTSLVPNPNSGPSLDIKGLVGGTYLSLVDNTTSLTINHDSSSVSAGTYGSSSIIPVITVDAQGHLTGVVNTGLTAGATRNLENAGLVNHDLVVNGDHTLGNYSIRSVGEGSNISINTSGNEVVINGYSVSGTSPINVVAGASDWDVRHDTSAITAGTYGDSSNFVSFGVDTYGHLTSATTHSLPSLTNAGAGTSLVGGSGGHNLKSLTAGTNITFTNTSNDITIDATGGSSGDDPYLINSSVDVSDNLVVEITHRDGTSISAGNPLTLWVDSVSETFTSPITHTFNSGTSSFGMSDTSVVNFYCDIFVYLIEDGTNIHLAFSRLAGFETYYATNTTGTNEPYSFIVSSGTFSDNNQIRSIGRITARYSSTGDWQMNTSFFPSISRYCQISQKQNFSPQFTFSGGGNIGLKSSYWNYYTVNGSQVHINLSQEWNISGSPAGDVIFYMPLGLNSSVVLSSQVLLRDAGNSYTGYIASTGIGTTHYLYDLDWNRITYNSPFTLATGDDITIVCSQMTLD